MSQWYNSGVSSQTALSTHPGEIAGYGAPTETTETATKTPPKKPFYKRRSFIICQIITALLGIALLFVLLWPVVHAIAQHVLDVSHLVIEQSIIQSPTNDSFTLVMNGYVTNTGVIPATIHWTEPVRVAWMRDYGLDNETEVALGYMTLEDLAAKNKRAAVNQTVPFVIQDQAAFGEFTKNMITKEGFTWRLASDHLNVNAAHFPQAKNLRFRKDVTLAGINSFNGSVILKSFLLPQEDPQGGITFSATTTLTNKSPFTVNLGTVAFDLSYEGVYMGRGTSNGVVIQHGENDVTLKGRLIEHTDPGELVKMGKLFTAYLNGEASPVIAKGVSTKQEDGTDISWLSDGLSALSLNVPFQAHTAINPIQSIDIGYLNLTFTPETAWSPKASSDQVRAKLVLPFGFPMVISNISNTFGIGYNGLTVASLDSPLNAASSDISVISSTSTQGTINIVLSESSLTVPSNAHSQFSEYDAALTTSKEVEFRLVGQAKTIAHLPVGTIVLDPIKFNVTSRLNGLQGLNGYTWIEGVDVMGGTSDYLELSINVVINNPSALNLIAGDLDLQLWKDSGILGTALLPDMRLNQGNNSFVATSKFRPNDTPQGLATLGQFLGGQDTIVTIKGYEGSTAIESLLPAFQRLSIDTNLPGLQSKLLVKSKMTVLDTTGHGNNIAHVRVVLADPFTSGFAINSVQASVKSSHGIDLGKIDQSTTFTVAGKQQTESPDLNLGLNLDPATMFTLLRLLATEAGLPTEQIDGIVNLGGYQYTQPVKRSHAQNTRSLLSRNLYTGFDLPSFVDKAFAVLKANINLQSKVVIGDYQTTLQYTQSDVPVETDPTLHLLLPILAQPLVQKIVDGSIMAVDKVMISDPQENSFTAALSGSITSAGPFDAVIGFPSGLTISWGGKTLGHLAMPDVQLVADVGATLNNQAAFTVENVEQLTEFTKTMITAEEFEWEISGQNLTVSAMGIIVPGISISKRVKLKGMNGLKGGVTINSFDLPSNDPAGGIHLTLDTTIKNPSQIGIQIASIAFRSYSSAGTFLGPVASDNMALAPLSTINAQLAGRLVPQDTDSGLADVSKIFTEFVHGRASNVVVQGDGTIPNVSWLSAGIKALRIESVLPSRGALDIIKAITINQMTLNFPTGSSYAPVSSSSSTTAQFDLPFGFPLDIVSLEQTIVAGYGGADFAQLVVSKIPATTDVATRIIHLAFEGVVFDVFEGQHQTFEEFLAVTTTSQAINFHLSGNASTEAMTAVGRLSISGIAFSVDSTLTGINSFGKSATLSDVRITGSGGNGGNEYIVTPLKTNLNNPSNISLVAGEISLPTYYQGILVGRANVANFQLAGGSNVLDAEFRYAPTNPNDTIAQSFLEAYLEGSGIVPITIQGDASSSHYESLVPALERVTLSAGVQGIAAKIVSKINVHISLSAALAMGEVSVDFDVYNPLDCDLILEHVQSDSGVDGETYAHFEVDFPNFVIPAKTTVNSGIVNHVKLTKGLFASLGLVTKGYLDLRIVQTGRLGKGGYQIPWLHYNQDGATAAYDVGL